MPVNLALWNCELWSGNVGDLKLLDTFHHRSLRRIMHMFMNQMKLERLTNKKVRLKFGNISKLSEIWKARLLLFIGRTARQPESRLSYESIAATIQGKRLNGRPFRTNKDAIVETMRELIPSTPHFGNTEH